jgi:mitochondrial inner membrane protease ATP23
LNQDSWKRYLGKRRSIVGDTLLPLEAQFEPTPSKLTQSTGNMATSDPPDPSKAPTPPSTTGADFLAGADMWTRWRNFYRMASGSMSPEGQKKYWHDADIRYEATDCKRCESQRDWLLQYSPIIRFMSDNIKQLGGDLGKHNMRCRRCETGMQGGFDAKYGIKLCANYVETRSQMEDTMAHEMVHAYDHLRFKVDWDAKDLRHVACTEVSLTSCSIGRGGA